MNLLTHSIETFTTSDGPGIRLVVFTQGCNLNCLYCQNPDTQDCKGQAKAISTNEIIDKLERQRSYFSNGGGLTISGGEPTIQSEVLIDLFKSAHKKGFHTCLDTNGFIHSDSVHELYSHTDLIIFDLKHIDNDWHKRITGQGNKAILQNIKFREDQNKDMWVRLVLVPSLSDQEEFLEKWAIHFKNYKNVKRFEILPYHTLGKHKYKELGLDYQLKNTPVPDKKLIAKAKQIFQKHLKNVRVR